MTEPTEVQWLRAAVTAHDLAAIEAFFLQWRASPIANRHPLESFAGALADAVVNNWTQTVTLLLDQGMPMNQTLFIYATQSKAYKILHAFLDHGWDINTPGNLITPPALAFAFDDEILIKWFLNHGADPDARCDHRDCTPLSWAVQNASFSTIRLLFNRGGTASKGQLLHYAAMRESADRLEVLNFVLEKGLPINNIMYQDCLEDYYRNMYSGIGTPLHHAAGKGFLNTVKFLVDKGACPLIKDPTGKLALHWAEHRGHMAVVKFLRPLSISLAAPQPQFTDQLGHHFTPLPLEEFLKEGIQLV